MNIAAIRKKRVIQQISSLSDDKILMQIERFLKQVSGDMAVIQKYVRPIRKKTDVNALIRKKNYKGIDKKELKRITQSFDVPQSTDELLAML